MQDNRKSWLLTTLLALVSLIASHAEVTFEGIRYQLTDDGKAEIAKNNDCKGDIVIPNTITYQEKTYQVTSMVTFAFFESEVTSIKLPDAITTISESAFNKCRHLKRITLPSQLVVIEYGGFYLCESLDSIVCPSSLKEIRSMAFWGCSSLKNLVLNDGLEVIKDIAFAKCEKLEKLVLPASLTEFDGHAFEDCQAMRYIDCRMTNPPAMKENYFANAMKYMGTLHVPSACKNTYNHTNGWKEFSNIVEDNDGREMVDIHIRCNGNGSVQAGGKSVKATGSGTADMWLEIERGSNLRLDFFPTTDPQHEGPETEVTRLTINTDSISPLTIMDNTYTISQIQDELNVDVTFGPRLRVLYVRQADGGSLGVRYKQEETVDIYVLPNENAEVDDALYDGMPLSNWVIWNDQSDNHYNLSYLTHDTTIEIRYKKKEE